ncbi:RNA polymerase sigma-70 factor (ECF subfamily) [Stackebrandtia endophytica]|uniref:RNA polymerase sigma-70 factor (ECF subfamily) n=1 Tax=Stackebrandtia endophytica TaxID=1496996 RepID=A0A543B3S4_9ACTN|nr:sigma-70 family RNA polymerase sigma factor [Stackebrandtia endophytica]TQL79474.1 RNA polymerase sigma-70 factor (ECF subfamily) [Stackebrandtia endophytica]
MTNTDNAGTESLHAPDDIKAALAGDLTAFESLYRQHYPQIKRVIYRRMQNTLRSDAEDMISETFYRAMSRIDTFQWKGTSFGAWLTTIAIRLVLDYHRAASRREVPSSGSEELIDRVDLTPGPAELAVQHLDHQFKAHLVGEILTKLTDRQRYCLYLRFQRGQSVAETAQRLGISEDAVKTLQHRAIRRTQTLLTRRAERHG